MENKRYEYPIPEIGKIYDCYDDGKIKESRRYQVKITRIIPITEMTSNIEILWNYNTKKHDWLFKETDFFIESISYETPHKPRIEIFARDSSGGWFGLGEITDDITSSGNIVTTWFCSGKLDVKNEYKK